MESYYIQYGGIVVPMLMSFMTCVLALGCRFEDGTNSERVKSLWMLARMFAAVAALDFVAQKVGGPVGALVCVFIILVGATMGSDNFGMRIAKVTVVGIGIATLFVT